jgi:hypothetical protein
MGLPASEEVAIVMEPVIRGLIVEGFRSIRSEVVNFASASEGAGRDCADVDSHSAPLSATAYILAGGASSSTADGSPRENRANREPGLRDRRDGNWWAVPSRLTVYYNV